MLQSVVASQFQILVNQCSNLEGKRQSLQNQLEVERINAGEQITFLEQKLRGVQVKKWSEISGIQNKVLAELLIWGFFQTICIYTISESVIFDMSDVCSIW